MDMACDRILVSSSIYDSVSKEPYQGYIVLKDGRISDVGKGKLPAAYTAGGLKVQDCKDGTICAGFGDTHTFFTGYVIDSLGVNLSHCKTLKELRDCLEYHMETAAGKGVLFGNHLESCFLHNNSVDTMLEEIGHDTAIVLFAPGHGTCAMNQKARQAFGFDPQHCHAEALYKIMGLYLNDRQFIDRQIEGYMKLLNSRGVTSVKEMGFDDFYGFTDVLKELEENERLTLRISFMSQPVGKPADIEFGLKMKEAFQGDYVRFSGFNQMTDGLILKMEGHLRQPYEGTDSVCNKDIDYKQLEKEVLLADKNGLRFTLHSEGDGAFHEILNIYDQCEHINGRLKNRHGITDLELTEPEDEKRMAKMGAFGEIYAQVYALDTYDGYVNAYRDVIGARQERYLNYRSLADHGVRLCGATDLPLLIPSIPESIFYGCANFGSDKQKRINPQNGLTISEMLDAWTVNSQFAMEREDELGTLEAGKKADIVIFDRDLFKVPMDEMLNVQVKETIVNGKTVYTQMVPHHACPADKPAELKNKE